MCRWVPHVSAPLCHMTLVCPVDLMCAHAPHVPHSTGARVATWPPCAHLSVWSSHRPNPSMAGCGNTHQIPRKQQLLRQNRGFELPFRMHAGATDHPRVT
eukprot:jgi/Botrbrau1/2600/Bobra.145_1s0025.1